jgi:peptide/nickel transport system substrate-binding protein
MLVHPQDELHTRTAMLLQQMWAEVGAKVSLQPATPASLVTDYLTPRNYQAALAELDLSRFPDPDPYPFWHQTQASSGQNYAQLDDRSISEVLEIARTDTNPANRAKLYRTFQYRFDYQVPAVLLWFPTYSYALDARLSGVMVGPLVDPSDRLISLPAWYLLSARATPPATP